MSRFTADPDILIAKGNQMLGQATDFEAKIRDVYQTVEQMLAKDYISPEARVIGNNIQKCREILLNVPRMINAYGEFYIKSGNSTVRNQDNIASGFKP